MVRGMKGRLTRIEKIVNFKREDLYLVDIYLGEYMVLNAITGKDYTMSKKKFIQWSNEVDQVGSLIIIDDISPNVP